MAIQRVTVLLMKVIDFDNLWSFLANSQNLSPAKFTRAPFSRFSENKREQ